MLNYQQLAKGGGSCFKYNQSERAMPLYLSTSYSCKLYSSDKKPKVTSTSAHAHQTFHFPIYPSSSHPQTVVPSSAHLPLYLQLWWQGIQTTEQQQTQQTSCLRNRTNEEDHNSKMPLTAYMENIYIYTQGKGINGVRLTVMAPSAKRVKAGRVADLAVPSWAGVLR